jgi:hypothetical protein
MDEAAIWLELIDLALSRARISQKRAALDQGISLEQWYQQRNGKGHISLLRMFRLPTAFWSEFIPILAEHFGVSLATPELVQRLTHLIQRSPRSRRRSAPTRRLRQGRMF